MIRKLFVLYLIAFSSILAQSNEAWLGKIRDFQFKEKNEIGDLQIEVEQNREVNGATRLPDENSLIFYEDKKNTTILILDKVKLSKFEKYSQTFKGFVQKIYATTDKGSYRIPSLRLNRSGQEVTHVRIYIETEKKASIKLIRSEKQKNDQIKFFFQISRTKIPPNKNGRKKSNQVEILASDFDEAPSAPLQQSIHRAEIKGKLDELFKMEPDQFVTAVYPIQYADPENIFNLVRNKKSVLGTIDLNRDNASLLITDRAEFTRSLLMTLLALDQKIPQVIIELKIVEVSSFDTNEVGVNFSYLKQRGDEVISGGYKANALPSQQTNISGVFSDVDAPTLKQFLGDLQLLAQKNKVEVLANSTLAVLNNRQGSFSTNQGNTYFVIPSINESSSRRKTREKNLRRQDEENLFKEELPANEEVRFLDDLRTSSLDERRENRFDSEDFSTNRSFTRQTSNTGVSIVITPKIRNSAEAVLRVQPNYSEIIGFHRESGTPLVATRTVNTEVRLKHGETVIIGGLFRRKKLKQSAGLPVLKDIPLVGYLFSSEVNIEEKNEIVFMLTCYIQYN